MIYEKLNKEISYVPGRYYLGYFKEYQKLVLARYKGDNLFYFGKSAINLDNTNWSKFSLSSLICIGNYYLGTMDYITSNSPKLFYPENTSLDKGFYYFIFNNIDYYKKLIGRIMYYNGRGLSCIDKFRLTNLGYLLPDPEKETVQLIDLTRYPDRFYVKVDEIIGKVI